MSLSNGGKTIIGAFAVAAALSTVTSPALATPFENNGNVYDTRAFAESPMVTACTNDGQTIGVGGLRLYPSLNDVQAQDTSVEKVKADALSTFSSNFRDAAAQLSAAEFMTTAKGPQALQASIEQTIAEMEAKNLSIAVPPMNVAVRRPTPGCTTV